jgi:hydrogenase nickel incorporation protein HypA/HybF
VSPNFADTRTDCARSAARTSHSTLGVHELALMESVIELLHEQLDGQQVAVVRLEIGTLAGVAIDALRFCFEVCARGTEIEGATLDVIAVQGRSRCRVCHGVQNISSLATPCTCGSFDRELLAGDELRLKEVEVV